MQPEIGLGTNELVIHQQASHYCFKLQELCNGLPVARAWSVWKQDYGNRQFKTQVKQPEIKLRNNEANGAQVLPF